MRRVFNTDPTDSTRVIEAVYDGDELVESTSHEATKFADENFSIVERSLPEPQVEPSVEIEKKTDWVKWGALALAIFEVVRDAIF